MNFQIELVVVIAKIRTQMRGGTKLVIMSCILFWLPIEPIETPIVLVSVELAYLHIPITPKHVPLTIPHIEIGVEVNMINIALHPSKVFRTPKVMLRDTYVVNELQFEQNIIVEPIDVLGEKHVDDLTTCVKHVTVALGD